MIIKFLQDYRGVATNENFYLEGAVVDVSNASARALIADKHAEEFKGKAEAESLPAEGGMPELPNAPLVDVDGVNEALAEKLGSVGVTSARDLASASLFTLARVDGIGEKTAKKLRAAAEELLAAPADEEDE